MYDDILGPKRKADKKLKTIWNKTYWKKNSTFQVDYATPNGRKQNRRVEIEITYSS